MKYKYTSMRKRRIIICFSLMSIFICPSSKSAEEVTFVSGSFSRTISFEKIQKLAKTGKISGKVDKLINSKTIESKESINLLTQKFELPLTLTSRLINSRIGEVVIKRVAKIIHPFKVPDVSVSVPAIRSAIIKGLVLGKGEIDLMLFIKAYPNKNISINVPALLNIINKVESISELVRFFSDSPLEGFKNSSSKT